MHSSCRRDAVTFGRSPASRNKSGRIYGWLPSPRAPRYYAAQYLKVRNLSVQNLKVRVIAEKAQQPAGLALFQIEVMSPGLEERHKANILRGRKGLPDSQYIITAAAY
jgi:hypothetical protein